MKIFDCFMYYDEDLILDLRLNYLNNYVDKFVIVESSYTHSGDSRKCLFDIKNYSKFKDKINYIILEESPVDLSYVKKDDSFEKKKFKTHFECCKKRKFTKKHNI